MDQDRAAKKVFPGTLAPMEECWRSIDDYLIEKGLSRDVKTVYVSYTDEKLNLVAAAHPDPTSMTVELALAIEDRSVIDGLYDATHLKWRNLPLAMRISPADEDLTPIHHAIDIAVDTAPGVTPRDPDDFRGLRRGRR